MKVFAGFIRKYYQSFFSFISKNISLLSTVPNVECIQNDSFMMSQKHQMSHLFEKNHDNTLEVNIYIFIFSIFYYSLNFIFYSINLTY